MADFTKFQGGDRSSYQMAEFTKFQGGDRSSIPIILTSRSHDGDKSSTEICCTPRSRRRFAETKQKEAFYFETEVNILYKLLLFSLH